MKFCKDCKYFRRFKLPDMWGHGSVDASCLAPEAEEFRNPVTGDWPTCDDMREPPYRAPLSLNGICGPDAEWFKARESDENAKG